MIRLAEHIRQNVAFPPAPDGSEFTRGQIVFGTRLQDDQINIVQVIDRGGDSGVGGKLAVSNVHILARSDTPGYAYDLIHAVYNSSSMGGTICGLKRYRNQFYLPAYDDNGLVLPELKIITMRPLQRPVDLGPGGIGYIWSVNYELKFSD